MRFERTTVPGNGGNGDGTVVHDMQAVWWKKRSMRPQEKGHGRPVGREDTPLSAVAIALRKARGNLTKAAHLLGIDRSALWRRVNKYPELQEIIYHENERWIDEMESVAFKRGKRSDEMTRFVLKTKGKYRGWSERLEIGGPGGGPIEITVTYDADGNGIKMKEAQPSVLPSEPFVEAQIEEGNGDNGRHDGSSALANPGNCPGAIDGDSGEGPGGQEVESSLERSQSPG